MVAEVVIAPPSIYVDYVSHLSENSGMAVSAQNCWIEPKGAFTGEISAEMIKDAGVNWVILGHSERRVIFNESSEVVAKKTKHAIDIGLNVILCVGEQLFEREQGKQKLEEVVSSQLSAVSALVQDWSHVVIAYEPVWAIGTGKTATPEQAQEMHAFIRQWLSNQFGPAVAERTRIIYGGSVKADNANDLSRQHDIDGFLVGGASLIASDFVTIVGAVGK